MKQYEVLQYGYSQLIQLLTARGKESGLFTVFDGGTIPEIKKDEIQVVLDVCDLCQIQTDKTGQRIIAEEVLYDLPAIIVCIVDIGIYAAHYARVLEAVGSIVAFFKDTSIIPLQSYNWHGNTSDKLYIEPFIRSPASALTERNKIAVVHMQYKLEAGINSERGSAFKRVEKRDIRSDIKDDKAKKHAEN